MNRLSGAVLLLGLLFAFDQPSIRAQVPNTLSFQGMITDSAGVPIDNPAVSMTFKLYKASSEVWTETHETVPVVGGVFNVLLGTSTSLSSVAFDAPIEVGITVGGDEEISPRTLLGASPYALGLRGLDSLLARIAKLEEIAAGAVLGASSGSSDASINSGGKTGIEGAHAMCQSTYTTEPTAHLCSYDEVVRALSRGAIGDTASYNGVNTWTVSVGHDESTNSGFNTLSENTCRMLLTGSGSTGTGSRMRVDIGFTPADNDVLTGTHIEIEANIACNNVLPVLCCL